MSTKLFRSHSLPINDLFLWFGRWNGSWILSHILSCHLTCHAMINALWVLDGTKFHTLWSWMLKGKVFAPQLHEIHIFTI